jgi:hypothetical protein
MDLLERSPSIVVNADGPETLVGLLDDSYERFQLQSFAQARREATALCESKSK